MADLIDLSELLTTRQAAVILGVQDDTLTQWRWLGKGPKYLRLGDGKRAAIRYLPSDLKKWLAERSFANTSQYTVDANGQRITPPWQTDGASVAENSAQPIQSGGHAVSPSPAPPASSPDREV